MTKVKTTGKNLTIMMNTVKVKMMKMVFVVKVKMSEFVVVFCSSWQTV